MFHYGIDLVSVLGGDEIGMDPSLLLALVQRLPDDSMTTALASGGRHLFGWGTDRRLLADLYDALNFNTRASGNWKKGKAPKLEAYPRPEDESKKRKRAKAEVKSAPTARLDRIFQMFAGGKR